MIIDPEHPLFLVGPWIDETASINAPDDENFAILEQWGISDISHEIYSQWFANVESMTAKWTVTQTPVTGDPIIFEREAVVYDAGSFSTENRLNNTGMPYPRNIADMSLGSGLINVITPLYLKSDMQKFGWFDPVPVLFIRNKKFYGYLAPWNGFPEGGKEHMKDYRFDKSGAYLKIEYKNPGETSISYEQKVTINSTFY